MEKQNLLDIAEVIEHEIAVAKTELLVIPDLEQKTRLRVMIQIMTVARLGMLRASKMCKE